MDPGYPFGGTQGFRDDRIDALEQSIRGILSIKMPGNTTFNKFRLLEEYEGIFIT